MKRALLILTCLPFVAAAASAQTPSTTTIVPSTATAVSTAPATAPTQVQPSTAPATAPGAWRPGRGAWHRDCDADVQRLCPGLTTRDQVEDCLRRNEAQLSPACQQIRKQEGRHRR